MDEATCQRVVESSAIVVQTGAGFPALAGEEAVDEAIRQGVVEDFAEGAVLNAAYFVAGLFAVGTIIATGDQGGGAEVVAVEVV